MLHTPLTPASKLTPAKMRDPFTFIGEHIMYDFAFQLLHRCSLGQHCIPALTPSRRHRPAPGVSLSCRGCLYPLAVVAPILRQRLRMPRLIRRSSNCPPKLGRKILFHRHMAAALQLHLPKSTQCDIALLLRNGLLNCYCTLTLCPSNVPP